MSDIRRIGAFSRAIDATAVRGAILALHLLVATAAFDSCKSPSPTEGPLPQANEPPQTLIPVPAEIVPGSGSFEITSSVAICYTPATDEMRRIAQYLADRLTPATGFQISVKAQQSPLQLGNIYLTVTGGDASLGEEGYILSVDPGKVVLSAFNPAGLFRGVQTIRQLLPASIERSTVQPGPWRLTGCAIRDYPRFSWRGSMLDVARHFFGVADVKRYIDLMAYYKMNRFHLHLSDDQGWRIMISTWPNLALIGGSTQVGGGAGGYFTQAEYTEIVDFALQRYITVVPEIDMPGHVNAAQASYAVLNCSGIARPLYTGTGVGFSALCVGAETTYAFIDAVVKEIAALTPGPYMHVGGDEATAISTPNYIAFVDRIQTIAGTYGKQMIGWEEIGQAHLVSSSVAQHWASSLAESAVRQGAKAIMSPAERAYLDMKYTSSTVLGQNWAGYIEVQDGYSWDPSAQVTGVGESDILGVEAPLWTETIHTMSEIEYMAYPRLAGYAEIGWSPQARRSWDDYKRRLASHGPRLSAMGVNYYPSPQVPWQ